jgi:hypothetical protein
MKFLKKIKIVMRMKSLIEKSVKEYIHFYQNGTIQNLRFMEIVKRKEVIKKGNF